MAINWDQFYASKLWFSFLIWKSYYVFKFYNSNIDQLLKDETKIEFQVSKFISELEIIILDQGLGRWKVWP